MVVGERKVVEFGFFRGVVAIRGGGERVGSHGRKEERENWRRLKRRKSESGSHERERGKEMIRFERVDTLVEGGEWPAGSGERK